MSDRMDGRTPLPVPLNPQPGFRETVCDAKVAKNNEISHFGSQKVMTQKVFVTEEVLSRRFFIAEMAFLIAEIYLSLVPRDVFYHGIGGEGHRVFTEFLFLEEEHDGNRRSRLAPPRIGLEGLRPPKASGRMGRRCFVAESFYCGGVFLSLVPRDVSFITEF